MKSLRPTDSKSRRRGATVVLTAISLVTLLLCASLAVDVGYICALTAEAQNNADAGALAGANLLMEEKSHMLRERVLKLIGKNQRPQRFLSLDDQLIEVGVWDSVNQKFIPLPEEEWEDGAFAVRVRAARNRVPLFFAAIAGRTHTDVWREAVAVGSRDCEGIWGLEGIDVVGTPLTDSYDSSDGAYDALTAGSNGDLCSGRYITTTGTTDVNGDAMAGFGYPVTVKGGAYITGMTSSNIGGVTAPPVEFGEVEFANDNASIGLTDGGRDPFNGGLDFRMAAGDSLTINPGTYFFESMDVHSTSTLTFTGPTTIYVKDNIDIAGAGIINDTKDANNLTFMTGGTDVKLGGAFAFYGTVYAPYADVNLGGTADYYGALVGRTVKMHGTFEVHVDESLPMLAWFNAPPVQLVK